MIRNLFTALLGILLTAGALLAEDNTPPAGFTALFNGKNLDGWKGLVEPLRGPPGRAKLSADDLAKAQKKADDEMRAHWSVDDGVLLFDGRGLSLCTLKDYANFELYLDWKIEKDGDSGVYLRGAPQVQIWDPASAPAGGVGSGGLYNNTKHPKDPTINADRPIGQWNTFYIKMIGDRVSVKLNDILVVDNVVLENYWDRKQPLYRYGQIELQNHHSRLAFKNIYIRPLPLELALHKNAQGVYELLLDGSPIADKDFEKMLAALQPDDDFSATLSADKDTPYEQVARMIKRLESLGVKKVSLATKSDAPN